MRKGQKHSEASKLLVSENRKGKTVGHPFWGNQEALIAARRKQAEIQKASRPIVKCARPECEVTFRLTSKQPNKRYCSISCARKVDSALGARSRGRAPAEGSGRCKWYSYRSRLTGDLMRVQGTWELRVANCLDEIGRPWRTNHNRDRFDYVDINDIPRTYAPDFMHDGIYLEVKGYIDAAAWHKIAVVQQSVPLIVVRFADIVSWEKLLFGRELAGTNATRAVLKLAA